MSVSACMCYLSNFLSYLIIYLYIEIFIGFQLPNTTYPEVEETHDVTLIKGAGNVTEQEILVVLNLVEAVPPGTSFDTATLADQFNDNDFRVSHRSVIGFFPPEVNEITVPITIFDDKQPENTEAAQLVLEVPTEEVQLGVSPPYFEFLPQFPSFFIIIQDNDRN